MKTKICQICSQYYWDNKYIIIYRLQKYIVLNIIKYIYFTNFLLMNKFLRILATLFMFILNYLAMTDKLWWLTTSEVSAKFFTLITPAGFTFAIWSLIYLGILMVSFLYLFRKKVILKTSYKRYLLSCLANGLWIVARQYGNLHAAMALILILLVSLIMIDLSIKHRTDLKYYKIIRNIFLLYFGRVQIATLLMTTIYLTYALWWTPASTLYRAIGCVIAAWVINTIVLQKEKNSTTSIVAMRALIGIASNQWTSSEWAMLWKVCVIVFGVLAIQIIFQVLFYLFSKSKLHTK